MDQDIKAKINCMIKRQPLKEERGVYFFIPINIKVLSSNTQSNDFRERVKKKIPKFYEFITAFMNAFFEQSLGVPRALAIAFPRGYSEKTVVNIGSGISRIGNAIINLDCCAYSGVHIVADAVDLPFVDESVDMIISISLLEHMPEPEKALAEMIRVLKPNGYFYCAVPFMYPFHSAPNDYVRFTLGWFDHRLANFNIIRSGIDGGPITALTISLAYTIALIFSFGSQSWYSLLRDFFIVLFAPLRIFDFALSKSQFAEDVAASIYLFARKK